MRSANVLGGVVYIIRNLIVICVIYLNPTTIPLSLVARGIRFVVVRPWHTYMLDGSSTVNTIIASTIITIISTIISEIILHAHTLHARF